MNKNNRKLKRQIRTRRKIRGTSERPRLTVFRSNRYIYAQVVNDEKGETIIGVSEKHLADKEKKTLKFYQAKAASDAVKAKSDLAKALGLLIAKKAIDKKIKKVVFDRGSYAYHGRIKALAEGARAGGLIF